MNLRTLDPVRDLPAVAALLARTRARGGLTHPGGIQWWLRELGRPGFEAFVSGTQNALNAFVLIDDSQFAVIESEAPGPPEEDLAWWTADHVRVAGRSPLRLHVPRASRLETHLVARGFVHVGSEFELVYSILDEPSPAPLPPGYRFSDLTQVGDDAYIELHRAAWSDRRPSTYDRRRHAAVRAMPQFDPHLVTIVLAPGDVPVASCILWHDNRSRTAEIEPLGTHRDFRRLGLARGVVREAFRRAWQRHARHVLVWNDQATNPAAYGLYTGAGMSVRRTLSELEDRRPTA